MTAGLIHRVAARDRALLERLKLSPNASSARRAMWALVTHAGGALSTLSLSIAPLVFDSPWREAARRAALLLVTSHVVVQLVKRTVVRPRPLSAANPGVVRSPDRFSFPSGHSAAAISVALGYASVHTGFAIMLAVLAGLVGVSRVVLGVHYPADVLAGQMIAFITAAVLAPIL